METAVHLVRRAHSDLEERLRRATLKRPSEIRNSMREVLAHVGAELIALNTFVARHAPERRSILPLLELPAGTIRVEQVIDEATSARWLVEMQDALERHHREVERFLADLEGAMGEPARAELSRTLERWLTPKEP